MAENQNQDGMLRETADHRTRLTYEDYCRMPAGLRYELVEGDLRMVPSPSVGHQEMVVRLLVALRQWNNETGAGRVLLAPLDVVLSPHNVVQPDLLFVFRERLGIITEANVQGPPDLVVEILSPGTAQWDRVTKRRVYERYGVRELWLFDLEAKTTEVALRQGEQLVTVGVYPAGAVLTSPLLSGFALDTGVIFQL